jgi:hypothetical protein
MRHRTRHIHQTLVQHVTGKLDELGWVSDPVNYGTSAVNVQSVEPYGEGAVQPDGNLVHVTIDDSSEDQDEELGGGLISAHYILFIDVIGLSIPLSVAIADDMRLAIKNQVIPVLDFTSNPLGVAQAGHWIEFDNIDVDVPPAASSVDKRTWRVVSALVNVYMPDDTLIPTAVPGAYPGPALFPGPSLYPTV